MSNKPNVIETRHRKLYQLAKELGALDRVRVFLVSDSIKSSKQIEEDMFGPQAVREGYAQITFDICCSYKSVPDFRFVWVNDLKYYRVYQYSYTPENTEKYSPNHFPLVNVGDGITMADFICFYRFLHTNRANKRERRE